MNDPMLPQPWTITDFQWENEHTFSFSCESEKPFCFAPGQFNMLYLFGVGEVPISISGAAHEARCLRHTVRDVGSVTHAMAALEPGQQIGVRGPFGSPWPMEQAQGKDVLVVAGGLGLAPVRPIIYQVLAQREAYGQLMLLYGARNQAELLYAQELQQWADANDIEVQITLDFADDNWHGPVGVVTQLIKKLDFVPERSLAMVCGPEVMMRFSAQELLQRGLSEEHIYVSLERNMKCALGFCGHCQYGPHFICKDGPVFMYADVRHLLLMREV